MSRLIEPLESRTLLSTTVPTAIVTDLSNLSADLKTVHTAIHDYQTASAKDLQTLRSDLRTSLKANQTLLNTLRNDDRACFVTLHKSEGAMRMAGTRDVHHVLADDLKLLRNANDTAARTRLTTDISTLRADSAALTLGTDARACATTQSIDLGNIRSSNLSSSSVQIDAPAAQLNAASKSTAVQDAVSKLQSDVNIFATDAAAV